MYEIQPLIQLRKQILNSYKSVLSKEHWFFTCFLAMGMGFQSKSVPSTCDNKQWRRTSKQATEV